VYADRLGRVDMDAGLEAIARDWPDANMVARVSSIVECFKTHTATIGIIGLGYVGLPLACTVANQGFRVIGFDIDSLKVRQINDGQSYIKHIKADDIAALRRASRLAATCDFARLAEVDAIILCVPTPLTRQREPDLTFVIQTTEAIAPHLQ